VRAVNPGVVYCSISGYGQDGPRSHEAGHDINYQARAGLVSLAPGTPDAPATPAALVADIGGGAMPAMINILLALRQRDLTGEGCHLDVAMADAMLTFAWFGIAEAAAAGRAPGAGENMLAGGSPRYGLYATSDDRFLAVGALEQKFWDRLCDALALEPRLRDDRVDPAATREALSALIRRHPAEHWRQRLEPLDCCACVVASLEEAMADPHFAGRGLLKTEAGTGGRRLPLAALPIAPALRRGPGGLRPVPEVGEHNAAVLARAGPG
jgi:crotonobetainyl-CoA:carnitine CoA-transferase CaiB-like acyl-CoA transferase